MWSLLRRHHLESPSLALGRASQPGMSNYFLSKFPEKKKDKPFFGPRHTWGPIYGSVCLSKTFVQTSKLHQIMGASRYSSHNSFTAMRQPSWLRHCQRHNSGSLILQPWLPRLGEHSWLRGHIWESYSNMPPQNSGFNSNVPPQSIHKWASSLGQIRNRHEKL